MGGSIHMSKPEQPTDTFIFPEYQVRTHLKPLLKAAFDAHQPCPRTITVQQAKIILRDVQLEDVLACDGKDLNASIRLAADRYKKWAPWHLAEILAIKRSAAWKAQKDANRQAAKSSPIKPQMVQTQEQKDQLEADSRVKIGTLAENLGMVQWAQRQTGRAHVGFTASHLIRIKFDREER